MMNQMVQEHMERKDAQEQQDMQRHVTEYKKAAVEMGAATYKKRAEDHEELVRQARRDDEAALARIKQRQAEEAERHENAKREMLAAVGKQLEEKKFKYDTITEAALSNQLEKMNMLDQEAQKMDKERIKLSEKETEVKVRLDRANYDEFSAKKEKHEKQSEARARQELDKVEENQQRLHDMKREGRLDSKQATLQMVAHAQESMAQAHQNAIAVNQIASSKYNTENRSVINNKLQNVIDSAQDLNEQYTNISGVLDLLVEKVDVKKGKRKRAIQSLQQFKEINSRIVTELNQINRLLSSYELAQVDKNNDIRSVQAKIFEFADVIAYIQIRLENDCTELDEGKVAEFKKLKEELTDQLGKIDNIDEKRESIMQKMEENAKRTQQCLPSTSSANFAIQN